MNRDQSGVIYRLLFKSGKSYIGQTIDLTRRIRDHSKAVKRGSLLSVHIAWRKYGVPQIEILGTFPRSILNAKEVYFISQYNTFNSGYNMTIGGETSPSCNTDIAKKISLSMLGHSRGFGNKNALGNRFTKTKEQLEKQKKTWTLERRAKQSQVAKRVNALFHSAERRKNSSERMKGNTTTLGRFWINNGCLAKLIKGDIPDGWVKGRL